MIPCQGRVGLAAIDISPTEAGQLVMQPSSVSKKSMTAGWLATAWCHRNLQARWFGHSTNAEESIPSARKKEVRLRASVLSYQRVRACGDLRKCIKGRAWQVRSTTSGAVTGSYLPHPAHVPREAMPTSMMLARRGFALAKMLDTQCR